MDRKTIEGRQRQKQRPNQEKQQKQHQRNGGFSLIEMVITVAVLGILTSMIFLGTGVSRRKETDKFSRELCNQIRLARTVSMSKTGYWRLCLYLSEDGDYYAVQERGTRDSDGKIVWEAKSQELPLGHKGAVTYTRTDNTDTDKTPEISAASGSELIEVWRFNRDTGSCIKGSGTVEVSGPGKTRQITVYQENGYCEEK